MSSFHFGVQLSPQHTTWAGLREYGMLAEELGYDSLWSWDHLVPRSGDPAGPVYDCWQILAAWGAVTSRIRLGVLVSNNGFRHPAVLAKMAATLDHITNGRAILGLGAGWYQAEHDGYGIPFGTVGDRLTKLAEAVAIIRSLLTSPRTTYSGRFYNTVDAIAEPKPIQPHLPLLIGGAGERKTLRIVAQHADMWHVFGTPVEVAHKLSVLRAHCAAVGRDPATITPLISIAPAPIIRDDAKAIETWLQRVASANGLREMPASAQTGEFATIAGDSALRLHTPEGVANRLAEYWAVGVRGCVFIVLTPYDRETLERIAGEVRPRLKNLIDVAL